MPNGDEKNQKRNELIKNYEFTDEKLNNAQAFFDTKNVRLISQKKYLQAA